MFLISRNCEKCGAFACVTVSERGDPRCPHCQATWNAVDREKVFEECPFCQCRQFYVQKEFNRALGCLIVLAGILLVPKTFGLSLPAVALIDWLLYRRVPTVAVCYRCGAEYKGFQIPEHFKPFVHAIGEKYERESETRTKKP